MFCKFVKPTFEQQRKPEDTIIVGEFAFDLFSICPPTRSLKIFKAKALFKIAREEFDLYEKE